MCYSSLGDAVPTATWHGVARWHGVKLPGILTVDLETKRQRDEQTPLHTEHQRPIVELQRKAARFGVETPPQVLTEIEDIEQTVKAIDATITKLYSGAARETERHLMGKSLFDNGDGTD